jgi:predicted lysophospholipase L1 biosynthesis ABC-type transport system permease subunit
VKRDPSYSEPRWPAIAIWTVLGALLGVAFWIVVGGSALAILIGVVIGLGYGLFATRVKHVPSDD